MKLAGLHGIRLIHCIGIGGVGVSGLAKILHELGYQVTGEDLVQSRRTDDLQALGLRISVGVSKGYLPNHTDVVIYSSAVRSDHPTLKMAQEYNIPCITRGRALGLLMEGKKGIAIGGAHGKTSTVGLAHQLLQQHQLQPTTVIGASLKSIQGHAVLGNGEHLLAEADESDGSLLFLKPAISVLTQIDVDHMGHYHHDFNRLVSTYRQFLEQANQLAIVCLDDPETRKLIESGLKVPLLTYGFNRKADICALEFHQANGKVTMVIGRKRVNPSSLKITVPLFGKHNAYNVLAAVAIALQLSIPDTIIQAGLSQYTGVERRLDRLGEAVIESKKITLIDDYAHHPREIQASIEAVKSNFANQRLVLVFQPHRYTRLRDLAPDFSKALVNVADVLVLLPVYSAGEAPIAEVNHYKLGKMIERQGGKPMLTDLVQLRSVLEEIVLDNDVILFQNAGDLSATARQLQSFWSACKRG